MFRVKKTMIKRKMIKLVIMIMLKLYIDHFWLSI